MRHPPDQVYQSGTLSYTIPQTDVVHMWCELDLTCRSAANEDWAVCTGVGFSFDRMVQGPPERFTRRMEREVISAGPGLFRVQAGKDEADVPYVECLALAAYRWLVWVPSREPDGLYEWTLWRAEDLSGDQRQPVGPGHA